MTTVRKKIQSMIKIPDVTPMSAVIRPGGSQTVTPGVEFWFSALRPVAPTAPDTFRPRQWPFVPGWNLIWPPRGEDDQRLPFNLLYQCAVEWDLFNCALETVVDKVSTLQWQIRKRSEGGPGAPKDKSEAQAQDDPQAAALMKRFQYPDGIHNFTQWMRMLLHDMYIADCATIFCSRDVSNPTEITGFMPLDGSTIKVLLDDMGRRPCGVDPETGDPEAAFQQIIYGMPVVDFTSDDLIYAVRNPYNQSAYGRSHLEQIVTYANMGIRHQNFQLAYYTEGNSPEMLLFVGPDVPAEKIEEWNELIDANLSGQLGERRKIKLLPGLGSDGKPNVIFPKEPLLKNDLDEWLARIVCFTLGLSPQAFTKQMNRASATQAQDTAEAEGQQPVIEWAEDTVNECLKRLGQDGYEFTYRVRREQDSQKQMTVDTGYLKSGVMTVNECRTDLGLDPYDIDIANTPLIETPQGAIKLEDAGQQAGGVPVPGAPGFPPKPGVQAPGGGSPKGAHPKPMAKRLVPAAAVAEHSAARKLGQKFREMREETEKQLREKLIHA